MKIMTSQMSKILEFQEKKFKTTLNKSNESLDNDTNEFQKIWKELAEFKKKFDQRQDRNFESDYVINF